MKTILDYADLVKEQHALNTTIAPVETDLTSASQAYAVGQKFVYDGVLYQAKTAIAQGAALVLNTNYEAADNLATEIQTLTNKLDNEVETRAKLGAHNCFAGKFTSQTLNNIEFNALSDGTVTATGTASATASTIASSSWVLKAGTYILNSNPLPGSSGKYTYISLVKKSDISTFVAAERTESASFTLSEDTEIFARVSCQGNGETFDVVFKPMIRLASDTNATYQPYAMTNRELTELATVEDLSSQVTLTENCFSCSLIRQGNICHVNVAAKSGVNGFTSIATIPADLKPKYNTPMACFAVAGADSSKIADAVLNTNGLISIRTTSATSDIAYLSCTWIV